MDWAGKNAMVQGMLAIGRFATPPYRIIAVIPPFEGELKFLFIQPRFTYSPSKSELHVFQSDLAIALVIVK